MTESEPTLEEMQVQILELKEQNETNKALIDEMKTENAKLNEDLGNARSLNAKLMRGLPAGNPENKEEEHQETPDEFLDSFIKPAIEKLGKR